MDVGAGIGTEVLTFADLVGETGWVHAIEAHPQTFRDLKLLVDRNIGRSIAANMTLDRYAAWGSNEPIRMSDGDEHIANSVGVGAGFNVEGITLDEFVQRRSIDRMTESRGVVGLVTSS